MGQELSRSAVKLTRVDKTATGGREIVGWFVTYLFGVLAAIVQDEKNFDLFTFASQ